MFPVVNFLTADLLRN